MALSDTRVIDAVSLMPPYPPRAMAATCARAVARSQPVRGVRAETIASISLILLTSAATTSGTGSANSMETSR